MSPKHESSAKNPEQKIGARTVEAKAFESCYLVQINKEILRQEFGREDQMMTQVM